MSMLRSDSAVCAVFVVVIVVIVCCLWYGSKGLASNGTALSQLLPHLWRGYARIYEERKKRMNESEQVAVFFDTGSGHF
jgi:predicted PurR-regulated permease PerM